MADREMTPSEAIIILDRLNTSERIEVDRDELRAAVVIAKAALNKQVPKKAFPTCEGCGMYNPIYVNYCFECGQSLDWSGV